MLLSLVRFRDIASAVPVTNSLKNNKNKNREEALLPPDAETASRGCYAALEYKIVKWE